jgi:hypothetical protein
MYPVEYRATRDSKLYHYVLQSVQGFEPTDLTIQETGFKMFERKKAGCLKKQKKKEMGQRLKKSEKKLFKMSFGRVDVNGEEGSVAFNVLRENVAPIQTGAITQGKLRRNFAHSRKKTPMKIRKLLRKNMGQNFAKSFAKIWGKISYTLAEKLSDEISHTLTEKNGRNFHTLAVI